MTILRGRLGTSILCGSFGVKAAIASFVVHSHCCVVSKLKTIFGMQQRWLYNAIH